jgi:methanethiol S-methyltransferase
MEGKMNLIIGWINFGILILSTLLLTYFYIRSAFPASLEKMIGPAAYPRCGRDRALASTFEVITLLNYVAYKFFPLPVPLPEVFPWSGWISDLIAVLIGLPSLSLLLIGIRHAGEEAVHPIKGQILFRGIYKKIRHPQAVGEVFLWWVLAFALNSPFLVLFSFVYIPLFILYCFAEEMDLVWRLGEDYVDYAKHTGAFWPKK